jgi:hypothetical protein
MGDNVIGFIGSEKYELILYLSRILYHLNKKVLLVDYSESKALYQCIPIPDLLHKEKNGIDYRGVDFIQGQYYSNNLRKNYDVILMDFDFGSQDEIILQCNKLFFVTDLQLHNVNRLNPIHYIHIKEKYLVIKDVFQCKIKPEYILGQFDEVIQKENVYILYLDTLDLKYKLQCQYNSIFQFNKLSAPAKYFLNEVIKMMDGNIGNKQLKYAFQKAERGK